MEMKVIFVMVALVCSNLDCSESNIPGGQTLCPCSTNPININVYGEGCQKNPSKPSAHIEAASKRAMTYQAGELIKDWNASSSHSHLVGGMTYHDGKLTVPTAGRYYIYLQIYFLNVGRVYVNVNDERITMIHSPGSSVVGSLNTGRPFNLNAADVITVTSFYNNFKIFMDINHSYFGAYLI